MELKLVIKKTARHPMGQKYLDMAKDGLIKSPVTLKETPGARLEASIDGEAIGYVMGELTKDDLPKNYDVSVVGLGDKPGTFDAVLTASDEDVSESISYCDETERIVEAGILTEDEVKSRISVMESNRVHPSVIKAVLDRMQKFEAPLCSPKAFYQDTRDEDQSSILNLVLIAALTRTATIFIGDKSTGKNICGETLAYVLGLPYYRIVFERGMVMEDVIGSKTTDNSAAEKLSYELAYSKSKLEYGIGTVTEKDIENATKFDLYKAESASIRLIQQESSIIQWAKNGGVMMYDEVNMADSNLLQAVMNSVADSEKVLIVPGVGSIPLNENCVLIGSMNPGYAGTCDLNEATKSRCGFIEFEYPKTITAQLKANFKEGQLANKYFVACEKVYEQLRVAVDSGRISSECLNIRGFVSALKAVADFPYGTKLIEQLKIHLANGCNKDERFVVNSTVQDCIDL